jgi:hypothetical protein
VMIILLDPAQVDGRGHYYRDSLCSFCMYVWEITRFSLYGWLSGTPI